MFKKRGLFRKRREEFSVDVSEQNGVRSLYLGTPTVQSSMRISDPYTLYLDYTQAMMAFLLFHSNVSSVACVGLGGGSIPKFIWKYLPTTRVDVVEISQEVIDVSRAYFCVPENDARLSIQLGDGTTWFDVSDEYDVVMLDAFDGHGVPDGFTSDFFIENVKRSLRHNGIYLQNLWANDPKLNERIWQIEDHFENNLLIPTEKKGNVVALAFKQTPPRRVVLEASKRARDLHEVYGVDFAPMISRSRSYRSKSEKYLDL
jgi:spermidine synthase